MRELEKLSEGHREHHGNGESERAPDGEEQRGYSAGLGAFFEASAPDRLIACACARRAAETSPRRKATISGIFAGATRAQNSSAASARRPRRLGKLETPPGDAPSGSWILETVNAEKTKSGKKWKIVSKWKRAAPDAEWDKDIYK